MFKPIACCVIIVCLPDAKPVNNVTFSKADYITSKEVCQQPSEKNTLEYNYITTENLIQENNNKYQDILW